MSRSAGCAVLRVQGDLERFAGVLLGALAFVIGVDLIVFSPVPVVRECRFEPLIAALDGMPPGLFGYHPRTTERYHYRTWPPGVVVAAAGVASICIGVYLRHQRRCCDGSNDRSAQLGGGT
jgi:hypothetical protein